MLGGLEKLGCKGIVHIFGYLVKKLLFWTLASAQFLTFCQQKHDDQQGGPCLSPSLKTPGKYELVQVDRGCPRDAPHSRRSDQSGRVWRLVVTQPLSCNSSLQFQFLSSTTVLAFGCNPSFLHTHSSDLCFPLLPQLPDTQHFDGLKYHHRLALGSDTHILKEGQLCFAGSRGGHTQPGAANTPLHRRDSGPDM